MQLILAAVMAMVSKLLSAQFIEFCILFFAEILVEKTENKYDDKFLMEVKKLLGRE